VIHEVWISILVLILNTDTGVEPGGSSFNQESTTLGVTRRRTEIGQTPRSIHVVRSDDMLYPRRWVPVLRCLPSCLI